MIPANPSDKLIQPLLPIYTGNSRNLRLVGSGCIYTVADRFFVVTAAHVASQVEKTGLVLRGPNNYYAFTGGNLIFARTPGDNEDRFDLAIAEVQQRVIGRLGSHVHPIDLGYVTMDFLIVGGMDLLFTGFPKTTNRKLTGAFRARAVVLLVEQVALTHPIYKPPLHPKVHICASFSQNKRRAVILNPLQLAGEYIAPDPDGMSGGLIYRTGYNVQAADQRTRTGIIGVAIEYDAPKRMLIGVHFSGVFELLRAYSPDLSDRLPFCDLGTGLYRLG